jgi:predicted protein tyrosine phosphatase
MRLKIVTMSCMQALEYVYFNRTGVDKFAIISIQETSNGGNGFEFTISGCCKHVLTLHFDDVNVFSLEEQGYSDWLKEECKAGKIRVFDDSFAYLIRNFIKEVLEDEDITTLIVHCAAGVSRSPAVAAAISQYLYGDDGNFFETQVPNKYVYEVLLKYLKGV